MLKGYITLITGVATGIGKETASEFLKQGAIVVGIDKTEPVLIENQKNFIFKQCDITNEEEIIDVYKFISSKFGKLDSLVTVPNKIYMENIQNINYSIFDEASRNILGGPILMVKNGVELLRKSGNPSIIHNISIDGFMINKEFLGSIFSSALINYVKQSSPQLRGIRVNGAVYGMIQDHLLSPEKEENLMKSEVLATIPSERLGTCKDVANLNRFLISDKARYLNSSVMTVDGGWYITHPRAMVQ